MERFAHSSTLQETKEQTCFKVILLLAFENVATILYSNICAVLLSWKMCINPSQSAE